MSDSGLSGIKLPDIQMKFQSEAPNFGIPIKLKEISTAALRRTLLALIGKRASVARQDGVYALALFTPTPEEIKARESQVAYASVGNSV